MKYFFVSDVHGCYDKLITALTNNNFDPEKDTLVSLGDPFDRGEQNTEVLDYLLKLPKKILVWGNHDLRLWSLLNGSTLQSYDWHNATTETINQLAGNKLKFDVIQSLEALRKDPLMCTNINKYFDQCVFAIEFKDLIGVHGWIPHHKDYFTDSPIELVKNWRKDATAIDWYNAVWAHTEHCIIRKLFPKKRLIIGHWHAWRLANTFAENEMRFDLQTKIVDCSSYITDKYIAIDGMSSYELGGCVNVYVYETDETPTLIKGSK